MRLLAWIGFEKQQLSMAHAAWRTGDWNTAEAWALRATRSGSATAHTLLATLYLNRNAPGDSRRAFTHSRLAAERGCAAGMQSLGWCFEQGMGVAQNHELALRWYRAAADNGRVDCQIVIARRLLDGTGGTVDAQAAKHYAILAKRAGATEADELIARAESAVRNLEH
jgi:TPR repeat protein